MTNWTTLCLCLSALVTTPLAQDAPWASPLVELPTTSSPTWSALADVTGDGQLDLITTRSDVVVLPGLGDGGFGAAILGPVWNGLWTSDVGLGDLGGDGVLDLVLSQPTPSGDRLVVLTGVGDGSFVETALLPLCGSPDTLRSLALADLDGDGRDDVLASCVESDTIEVFFGQPGGGLLAGPQLSSPIAARLVESADIDDDGFFDLLVFSDRDGQPNLAYALGDGLGGFGPLQVHSLGAGIDLAVVVDLDQDGGRDVVLANLDTAALRLLSQAELLGTGNVQVLPLPAAPRLMHAADLERDGLVDLVLIDTSDDLVVLRHRGGGLFDGPTLHAGSGGAYTLTAGDLDGDDDLELLLPHQQELLIRWPDGQGGFRPVVQAPYHSRFQLADFDADGRPDLVATTEAGVTVRLAAPLGHFGEPTYTQCDITALSSDTASTFGDFDADGFADVLFLEEGGGNNAHLRLGAGDGSFGAAWNFSNPLYPVDAASADLDGDGLVDALLSTDLFPSGGRLSTWLGQGDGTLVQSSTLEDGVSLLLLEDFDLDGDLDLVSSAGAGLFSAVHANDGGGAFSKGSSLAFIAQSLGVVDLGDDGVPDVWMSRFLYSDPAHVVSLRGHGDLTFELEGSLLLADGTGMGFVADVDSSHAGAEFVFLLREWSTSRGWLSVHRVTPAGQPTVSPIHEIELPGLPQLIQPVDLEGDGVLDLLMQDNLSGGALLLHGLHGAWSDLGAATAGVVGKPRLQAEGSLAPLSPVSLLLTDGPPSGSAWLVMGFSPLLAPFKGGTLVPSPEILVPGLPLDGDGRFLLQTVWPAGLPADTEAFVQFWMADAAGPAGFSASNSLGLLTP